MSNDDLIRREDALNQCYGYGCDSYERIKTIPSVSKSYTDRIEDLEAKLAQAVEALGRIAEGCEADYPPSHGAIKHDARTTIAEIEGKTNE